MILCIIWSIATVSWENLLSDINFLNQAKNCFRRMTEFRQRLAKKPSWEPELLRISIWFRNFERILQPSSGILTEKGYKHIPYGHIWGTPSPPEGSGLEASIALQKVPVI